MLFRSLTIAAAAVVSTIGVQAAYTSKGPNVMYYWGQNSAKGETTQSSLGTYCESGLADIILLSFLNTFNVGGLPGLNLGNACGATFNGTTLLDCPQVGEDIKTCQSLGVKIILSLGGEGGKYGFDTDADGATFADTIWDLFAGGTSDTRPFGDAVIDGIDLDIEGGAPTGYIPLVNAVRAKFGSDFLIGAAPQCPFPDVVLGTVLDGVGFDYINIQYYNNFCIAGGSSFNFETWATWAKTSPNPNVQLYFAVPGSTTAAGSGYVDIPTLEGIVPTLVSSYSGTYGGMAVWDASQAWNNGNFAADLYALVHGTNGGGSTTTSTTTSSTTTTVSSTTTTPVTTTTTTTTSSTSTTSTTKSTTKSTTTGKPTKTTTTKRTSTKTTSTKKTTTKKTTTKKTTTTKTGSCIPGSYGLRRGNGYNGYCCKDQSDCWESCIKGKCNGPKKPTTTKKTTTKKTTTKKTTTTKTGSCTPGSYGLRRGNGYNGYCCKDQSDCWESCIKGKCNGPKKPTTTKTTSTKKTTSKTTSTKTTSTKKTSSTKTTSTALPTSTSGTCVTTGQSCSSNGQYVCTTGGKYAVCDNHKWVVMPCPSGTTCIPTSDGASIYCGYSTGSKTCPALSARAHLRTTLNRGGAFPKAYSASNVNTQLTVNTATETEFSAVINARRTNASPFKDTVTIQFTAPSNAKYTHVNGGTVRQTGNSVRITVKNNFKESMALVVVDVQGTVKSGVYVAPNPSSLRVK